MTTEKNFEILASLLIDSAPTEKAKAFTEKVVAQVRARGESWINQNATALECLSDHSCDFCPVKENRVYFMTKLQTALSVA